MKFWVDWLEAQEPVLHTDAVIDHVELFHDCLTAALDWSTRDPRSGCTCCAGSAARGTAPVGRTPRSAGSTRCSPKRTPSASRCFGSQPPAVSGRPRRDFTRRARSAALAVRGRQLAEASGEEYWVTLSEWFLGYTEDNSRRLRQLAHERDERYVECLATILQGQVVVETPSATLTMLDAPDLRAAARESRYPRDAADRTAGRPRSPWAISAGASRSPADSARPRRC